jgi:hypothetical protein
MVMFIIQTACVKLKMKYRYPPNGYHVVMVLMVGLFMYIHFSSINKTFALQWVVQNGRTSCNKNC